MAIFNSYVSLPEAIQLQHFANSCRPPQKVPRNAAATIFVPDAGVNAAKSPNGVEGFFIRRMAIYSGFSH